MLMEAGADLEAASDLGGTPLHVAAENGHSQVMSVLVESGANLNSRTVKGATPLCLAAREGRVDAVQMLLHAKADPLLASRDETALAKSPLEIAVIFGHSEVVRELIQQVGIEGCGGESGGIVALAAATLAQRVDIMATLTSAGVVDNGESLVWAARLGKEASAKFLLQQLEGKTSNNGPCVNDRVYLGEPLIRAIGFGGSSSPSPRIVRLLVDAGADTASAVAITSGGVFGPVLFEKTPMTVATGMLRDKKIGEEDATAEQLHKLERIRRLLLQVEAAHAVSFLWPSDTPFVVPTAEGTRKTKTASTPLRMMLPLLRRGAGARRVLLATLFRWVRGVLFSDTSHDDCLLRFSRFVLVPGHALAILADAAPRCACCYHHYVVQCLFWRATYLVISIAFDHAVAPWLAVTIFLISCQFEESYHSSRKSLGQTGRCDVYEVCLRYLSVALRVALRVRMTQLAAGNIETLYHCLSSCGVRVFSQAFAEGAAIWVASCCVGGAEWRWLTGFADG